MDHLPIPIYNATRPPFQVPYTCTPRFSYDDQGFLTYPHRAGVDVQQLCNADVAASAVEASFVQAWLWFGLLGETLGIGSRTHVPQRVASFSAFMETLPSGRTVVTTKNLKQAVITACGKNESPLYSGFHRTRFDSCLAEATNAVNCILATPTCQRHLATTENFSDLPTLFLILLSVQLLVESLCSYRNILFATSAYRSLPKLPRLEHRPDLLDVLLREAGSCPYELVRFNANLQIKYFLSMTLQHGRNEHVRCSRDVCCREIIDEEAIAPYHTSPTCSCEMVSIADAAMRDIIDKGEIPILTFLEASGGKRRLQMRSPSGDSFVPFIAISHVRRLGLGNAKRNTLPYCQLSFLQVLANDSIKPSHNLTAFCVDTMCIPLEPVQRKRALRHLKRIFANADAVIALDPSLLNSEVGSELDCILRIRCSSWAKRLWTLQEGALAKELWFKFSNRTCELGGILEELENGSQLSILSPHQDLYGMDESQLLNHLAALDDDLKSVVEMIGPETLVAQIDKPKLYAILRLGYLGLPRYRYFREENERAQIPTVLQTLQQVYDRDRIQAAAIEVHALERLQQMCLMELVG